MSDMTAIFEAIKQRENVLAQAGIFNKESILAALSAEGIEQVNVTFDGEGDSGQLDNVIARSRGKEVSLPEKSVLLQRLASWSSAELTTEELPLPQALEQLCYDFLEQEHGGWENNDGAYGEFVIDVKAQRVELEFNGRFSDVCTSNYTF